VTHPLSVYAEHVAPKTPPALIRVLLPVALTLALASCGGGSTANPVAATTGAASPAATTPSASATTPAAPRTTATAPQTTASRARSSGGAGAPSASARSRSSTDASAVTTDEPAPAPATTSPTTPQPAAAAPPSQPAGSPIDERADLTLVRRESLVHYFQQGTVTGTYEGTMEIEARVTSKGVIVNFTATVAGGTIVGRGIAVAVIDGRPNPPLRGTAAVTGGTGRFAGIHGRRLSVSGRAKPDASHARVRLLGTVSY
jgi:hypothetical protein